MNMGIKIEPREGRGGEEVDNAQEISYTIRYPAALHKQLKFLAVDRDLSLNKLIISVLAREVQEARVLLPMNG